MRPRLWSSELSIMRQWTGAFALMAISALPAAAQDIDLRTAAQKAEPETWNVTLGARVGVGPAFPGAKTGGLALSPVFSLGRGVGSRWLSMVDDNISLGLSQGANWRAGVTGKLSGNGASVTTMPSRAWATSASVSRRAASSNITRCHGCAPGPNSGAASLPMMR